MADHLRQKSHRPKFLNAAEARPAVNNLVVIGASAGGLRAIVEIVKAFPADIPAAVIVLLHSTKGDHFHLPTWLSRFSRIPVLVPKDGEPLHDGVVYVIPPGRTPALRDGKIIFHEINGARYPATTIDRLFQSAALAYGQRVIGIVLSGLLKDGTKGLRDVYEEGGITVVQNPHEAEFASMPASALQNVPVTFCLNVSDIGPALDLLVRRNATLESGVAASVRFLKERVALLVRLLDQSEGNRETSEYLADELAALQRDLRHIKRLVHKVSATR